MLHVAIGVSLLTMAAAPEASVASSAITAQTASVQADASSDAVVVTPVAEGEEIGFIDLYFPFMPDPIMDQAPLEPEVQENFWLLYIVYALGSGFASPVWVHMIFMGDTDVGEDHLMEALIGWLIHLPLYIIFWIPILGWIAALANIWYLIPLLGINTLDRNVKKVRGKPPAKWGNNEALPPSADKAAANMAF